MCKHMRLQKMYFYGQVIMSSLFKIDKCKFFTRAFIFVCLKIIGNQLFSDMTVKEKGKVNSSQASTRWLSVKLLTSQRWDLLCFLSTKHR